MIIFLDIENTVIDDLVSCNWLEDNCTKISKFISDNNAKVILYTWGWTKEKEIDYTIANNIFDKLGVPNSKRISVLVKENSVERAMQLGLVDDFKTAMIPGMMTSEYCIDKTTSFLQIIHTKPRMSDTEKCVLIDDTADTDYNLDHNAISINPKDI